MSGMNAATGRRLKGLAHIAQSIAKILTTRIGTRVARRPIGSELPDLVDAPHHDATRLRVYAATATALMRYEPRIKVTRVILGEADTTGTAPTIDIEAYTVDAGEFLSTSVALSARSTK